MKARLVGPGVMWTEQIVAAKHDPERKRRLIKRRPCERPAVMWTEQIVAAEHDPERKRRQASGGGAPRAVSKVWILPLVSLLLVGCSNAPPDDPKAYVASIAAARAEKNAAFAASSDPIPQDKHAQFLPLAYFPIDDTYKVPAILKPSDDATLIDMPTSTGTMRKMRRAGTLEFTLKGQPLKFTAFIEPGAKSLFVPFSDMTSGTETYAAGRFLDLTPNAAGIYEIDFNKAYIPYCYYNPTYECPYPPAENRLKIPIRAGEKLRS